MSSTEFEHLKKAPIISAIAQIRVNYGIEFKDFPIESLARRLQKVYPKVNRNWSGDIEILESEVGKDQVSLQNKRLNGVKFYNEEGEEVFSVFNDLINLEIRSDYKKFEDFIDTFLPKVDMILELVPTAVFQSSSLRYINKIDVNEEVKRTEDYFKVYLTSTDDFPVGISEYNFSYVSRLSDQNMFYRLIHAMAPVRINGEYSFLLDIDVHKKIDSANDPKLLRQTFDDLRNLKNQVFFSVLTERTLKLLKG
ncbi:MAG: TIGR04255 family protein [Flavobacteriales bacterium]